MKKKYVIEGGGFAGRKYLKAKPYGWEVNPEKATFWVTLIAARRQAKLTVSKRGRPAYVARLEDGRMPTRLYRVEERREFIETKMEADEPRT